MKALLIIIAAVLTIGLAGLAMLAPAFLIPASGLFFKVFGSVMFTMVSVMVSFCAYSFATEF